VKTHPILHLFKTFAAPFRGPVLVLAVLLAPGLLKAHGEAMLELFGLNWAQLTQKMPEIAEAGYDSLWLPVPCKGNAGTYDVGYDPFDPFDLGSTNQQGTIATKYGTQAQLIQMVQMAHRFGIRVYFDNVMNHRAITVPGANANTPTNYYPGLVPQDFHLQTVGNYFANWPSVSDWCYLQEVENQPLEGLVDLANEPGTLNWNFGNAIGDTTNKPVFIRFPNRPDLYMDTNGVFLGTGWGGAGLRPFDGHGQPVPEDVTTYLLRAVGWTLWMTKCDGFRLDAVKHVPVDFFGNETGQTDDPNFVGYTGMIQAMYDYVHGYGNNVDTNGYIETDGNRNSLFNTDATRNDAMVFGEYEAGSIQSGSDYSDYLNSGMRLLNQPLLTHMNNCFGGGETLAGMDGRDFAPSTTWPDSGNCSGDTDGNFSAAQGVNLPQSQDGGSCCPTHEELQNAYNFMREGLPMVYSDGFNHNPSGGYPGYSTPIASTASYLGESNLVSQATNVESSDNRIPDIVYLHNQLARGGTWSRWSDQNLVIFERYDYRETTNTPDQDVALFALNDKSYPGDIAWDDGVSRTYDGYYDGSKGTQNSKGQGLVVGFPPGSVLAQLSSTATGNDRAYKQLLVHGATSSLSAAQSSATAAYAPDRLIYVGGQTIPSGGGAIELNIPSGSDSDSADYPIGGWVIYGYQWPEASRANVVTNAIILQQGGVAAQRMMVYRQDGTNGDPNYNPLFPFKMRGSVDPNGNVVTGVNVSNLTYAIDIPIVTNAPFNIIARSDASSANTLVKLDGGIDLNSQMGLGPTNNSSGLAPTNFPDFRDYKPGYAWDMFLGYEQTLLQPRYGPEKFAAEDVSRDNVTSLGAETYYYTVGSSNLVVFGGGNGSNIDTSTATWIYHNPGNTNSALNFGTPTQMVPTNPAAGVPVDLWVKVGYNFQTNPCNLYYTTDGSNPEGAFGAGKNTTKVLPATYIAADSAGDGSGWWKATIPGTNNTAGTQVRYKFGTYENNIGTIIDYDSSKLYGLSQGIITNFNPVNAIVWLHNDLNPANTVTGLQEGFHIIRARTFLPRTNKSSVFNTFSQTFYYDAGPPAGVFVNPAPVGATISNATYQVIVRADSSATELDYNIIDSNSNNDDVVTRQNNGNGLSNGVPIFVAVAPTTPTTALNTTYSNYPVEFHFNYVAVPTNGTATITVILKKATTAIFPGRVTSLTNTVNTAAPSQYMLISDPASDGLTLVMAPTSTFTINACYSSTLAGAANINFFSIFINGVFQPRQDMYGDPLYYFNPSDTSCGTGLNIISYDWTGATPGTNTIQVLYTNNVVLSDTRTVIVESTPTITGVTPGASSQYITWSSYPDQYYQVLSTTNLADPFEPLGIPVPGEVGAATFLDTNQSSPSRFYEIQVVQ
jgi:hypothetical protein